MKKIIVQIKDNYQLQLLIIIFIALILRIYGLGKEDFWHDEVRTIWYLSKDSNFIQVIKRVSENLQGPTYYMFMHFWAQIFNINEITLRIPSVVFGTITIYYLYKFTKELIDRKAALITCLLLSISYRHIYYSQEARTYSLTVLLTLISYIYFHKHLTKHTKYNSFIYILSSVLLINSHYFGFYIILAQNIFVLIQIVKRNFTYDKLIKWLISQTFILILILPTVYLFLGVQIHNHYFERGKVPDFFTAVSIFKFLSGSRALLYIFFIFSSLALLRYGSEKYSNLKGVFIKNLNNDSFQILLTWLFIPIITCLLISYFYKPTYYIKYFIISILPLYMLAGIGISTLKNRWIQSLVILFLVFYSFSYIAKNHNIYEKTRWSKIAERIDSEYKDGDVVIFLPDYIHQEFDYYSTRNQLNKIYLNKNEDFSKSHNINRLISNEFNQIWIVTWKFKNRKEELINILNEYKVNHSNRYSDRKYSSITKLSRK